MNGLARWLAAAGVAAAGAASAQTPLLAEAQFSADADRFTMQRVAAGAAFRYANAFDYTGANAGYTRYAQHGWSAGGARVALVHRDQVAATGEGLVIDVGVSSIGGRTRAVGEATFNRRLGESTGIELLAASDWVETRAAIEDGLVSTFAAASVEQDFGTRITAIALAGRQHFSDGNDRTHLRGRLIFAALPEQGVTLQLRYRGYTSSDLSVLRRYFNPESYENADILLSVRRRFATDAGAWTASAFAGGGRERIDRGTRNPTAAAGLRAEGPLPGRAYLRLFASYQRASGYEAGPDYWYSHLGALLILPLR